ncbi:type IV secretion system DNA-binding domain-containing protein [candidate division WWE3 bacterium]|uniref:Type IV secretion system DNA-binding domain-containing protein n=1 Tax=candidate division WWE3 bacterium TaxID=2053526 RepID=A0A955LKD5_UNCKA|nr:type IV secretion system DNA-binding domain-containing protein [candidate division WWE3 bacterium]
MIIPVVLVTLSVLAFAMAIKTVRDTYDEQRVEESVADGVLLVIKVPKENEQTPLAAEMFFAALHGLLQDEGEDLGIFSFEIVGTNEGVFFYTYVPKRFRKFIEGQIYAQYPTAEITEGEDYSAKAINASIAVRGTELILEKPFYYPIKSFPDFDVDPLAAITSSLEDMQDGEQIWFQLVVKPLAEGWQESGYKKIDELRTGKVRDDTPLLQHLISLMSEKGVRFLLDVLAGLVQQPSVYMVDRTEEAKKADKYEMTEENKSEVEAIKKKLSLLGFEVNMRVVGIAAGEESAQNNVSDFVAAFKQFSSGELNSFIRSGFIKEATSILDAYRKRSQPAEVDNVFVLNTEELASVYHLPNVSVATPNIDYILSKKAEPPLDLPIDAPMKFAKTTFRNKQVEFGVRVPDRRRHMYVLGKTGTGKSTLLRNMIIQDIRSGEGLAVIDPHGDLFNYVLDYIPQERLDDVVIFDPSDINYPVALNMFELFDPDQKGLVASGMVDVFRKRFEFSWGPRMEHLLRNTILTFLEIPHSSLLGVTRILVDRPYRRYIVNLVQDPILKEFWNNEFENMMANDRLSAEAVGPIQNRLGPFLATPTIRNLVGQAVGTIDLPRIMNEGKVFLVNLGKGGIGEDNSAILGSFLMSRLWFAALTRASIPEEERRDFHVYVDEFQNFATSSFASILSESRKYRMNLVMAHQYINQLAAGGDTTVRDAVFGNVGTMMNYVTGQEDAEILAKEYEPVFDANDVINLGKYQLYLKLMINSEQSRPFSAVALPPISDANGLRDEVVARSRARYGRPRDKVELAIHEWAGRTFAPGMDDDVVEQQRQEIYNRYKQLPGSKE